MSPPPLPQLHSVPPQDHPIPHTVPHTAALPPSGHPVPPQGFPVALGLPLQCRGHPKAPPVLTSRFSSRSCRVRMWLRALSCARSSNGVCGGETGGHRGDTVTSWGQHGDRAAPSPRGRCLTSSESFSPSGPAPLAWPRLLSASSSSPNHRLRLLSTSSSTSRLWLRLFSASSSTPSMWLRLLSASSSAPRAWLRLLSTSSILLKGGWRGSRAYWEHWEEPGGKWGAVFDDGGPLPDAGGRGTEREV